MVFNVLPVCLAGNPAAQPALAANVLLLNLSATTRVFRLDPPECASQERPISDREVALVNRCLARQGETR